MWPHTCTCISRFFSYIRDDAIHDRKVFIHRARDGKLEFGPLPEIQASVCGWHSQLMAIGRWCEPVVSLRSRLTWAEIGKLEHKEIVEDCRAIYYEVSRKPPNFATEQQVLASEQAGLYRI